MRESTILDQGSTFHKPVMPKAVIFDLDETLTDRSKSLMKYSQNFVESFETYLRPYVCCEDVYEILKIADGNGYRSREDVFARLMAEIPWANNSPEKSSISQHWSTIFPICSVETIGMYEVLENLKFRGVKLGIITNGDTGSQNKKIDALGIRKYFDTIIISDSVKVKKPDKQIFSIALDEMKIAASKAWYVGDHPTNDVLGSTSVGLTPVWVRGIHPWPQGYDEPLFQIDSLNQILSLIGAGTNVEL